MFGQELFNVIVKNTGLPEEFVRQKFESLIVENGGSVDNLSLDDVRELLADLMLDLISDTAQSPS